MSNADLYREFEDFGNKMKTIAILTLIGLIGTLVGTIIVIGTLISFVMSIIIIVFFLLVIGDLKKAGRMLDNNKDLLGFPLKFILGTIIRVIGLGFFNIGLFILLSIGIITVLILSISISLILIGIGLIIGGSVLRLLAWGGLKNFFEYNAQLFPIDIANESKNGAKFCKIGAILDITIILGFIADILRIVGYFKLASLKRLTEAPAQPMSQPEIPMSAPVEGQSLNYCPHCGSDVSMGARFCPSCGAEID
ncbi:MAG: zinc ribbon domain-containing protein [Promethearchaeota archaeon]|nr:MAG: zinc ribbon domain-containing protein [Candidatus Lokiarchaeota archaeon]